ncbi:MAG: phosphatidylserine decarboxylase [Candidatus Thermoplasmatota archaeon]|nr:phosphatidylserine decarboxylase [Candidatus Thermoplasmatota archaeon]
MVIAKGSKSWILTPLIIGVGFTIFSIFLDEEMSYVSLFFSFILILLAVFFLIFFRDPLRIAGKGIVSPADGRIREISDVEDKVLGKCKKISIFMNIYNVHVNRMPIDGKINGITHHKGSYIPAFKKESERNERVEILLDSKIGMIKIIQIAGTLARRIVTYVSKGDVIKKGDKIGIIRLGSRVDIFIPSNAIKTLNIKVGDTIKAGEDTLAEIND